MRLALTTNGFCLKNNKAERRWGDAISKGVYGPEFDSIVHVRSGVWGYTFVISAGEAETGVDLWLDGQPASLE